MGRKIVSYTCFPQSHWKYIKTTILSVCPQDIVSSGGQRVVYVKGTVKSTIDYTDSPFYHFRASRCIYLSGLILFLVWSLWAPTKSTSATILKSKDAEYMKHCRILEHSDWKASTDSINLQQS